MKWGSLLSVSCLSVVLFGGMTGYARAAYPDKPIRIIVPYTPGGFNDTFARVIGQKLTQAWGQKVIVDNRPGGGTLIGMNLVAKAAPDGYTLGIAPFPMGVNPSLYKKLPYDTLKDFTPIILGAKAYNILAINPKVPIHSVKELIAQAKARPGKLYFGSAGNGSSNQLSAELFKMEAHVDMTHVPYKGSAPAVTDLMGGRLQLMFDNAPNILPHVKAGQLRAIAVTSPTRLAMLPNVPTVAESGLPGYEVFAWFGVIGPRGMPRSVVDKLNKEINDILKMPDVQKRFETAGVVPVGDTPEQFAAFIRSEINKWTPVVKAAHVTID